MAYRASGKFICTLLGLTALTLVAACSTPPKAKEGQFWQRVNASDATYIRGTKAQQLLNRNISRCVTDLRELERLGQLRDTIPTSASGKVLGPDELALRGRDAPQRDGALLAEHYDYHDFESCMLSNGWERTSTIPFETARRAGESYSKNHVGSKSIDGKKRTGNNTFRTLNE